MLKNKDLYITACDNMMKGKDRKNFDDNYISTIETLRKYLIPKYVGFKMPIINGPYIHPDGSKTFHKHYIEPGSFLETDTIVTFENEKQFKDIKPFPNGKDEFPDIRINFIYADIKTALRKLRGCCYLYKVDDFKVDFKKYQETGELSDKLRSIIIYFLYDGNTNTVTDVLIVPAIYCLNVNKKGHFTYSSKHGQVQIGFKTNKFCENPVFFGEL